MTTRNSRNQRATRHGDPWKDKPLKLNADTVAVIIAAWRKLNNIERIAIEDKNPEIDWTAEIRKESAEIAARQKEAE
jgi:hypothetical protein